MKNSFLILSLSLAIGAITALNSCKKAAMTSTADASVSAQDVAAVNNGVSNTNDDATALAGHINQIPATSGDHDNRWHPFCGSVTIDSTNHQMVINYDGSTHCLGHVRSGSITITLTRGAAWSDMNAQLTVVYNNLRVKDDDDDGNFVLNGTHLITNETGGLAWQVALGLAPNTTVKHRIQSSNMTITFANGEQRMWSIDRTREWTSAGTMITVSEYSENTGNVDVWGTNRFGTAFTNSIPVAIAADNNMDCPWKPYQGKTEHAIANRITTIVFGTDANGTPIGTPTVCGLGYYITYMDAGGHSRSRFVGYWH